MLQKNLHIDFFYHIRIVIYLLICLEGYRIIRDEV